MKGSPAGEEENNAWHGYHDSQLVTSHVRAALRHRRQARRFLEHEAVRSATTEHKRHFLERKGLSAQQIDEAMRPKANASDGNPASVPPSLSVSQQSPAEAPVEAQQSPAEGQRSNYGLVAIARGAPLLLGCVVGAAMTAVAMAATRRWHESDTAAAPVQSSGAHAPSRSPRTDAAPVRFAPGYGLLIASRPPAGTSANCGTAPRKGAHRGSGASTSAVHGGRDSG